METGFEITVTCPIMAFFIDGAKLQQNENAEIVIKCIQRILKHDHIPFDLYALWPLRNEKPL